MRAQQRLSFSYQDHAGHESSRVCEPYRVVHDGRRWYLIAWDLGRSDFRTFRADTWHVCAGVKARASAEALTHRVPPAVSVEPLDETHCVASVGADTLEMLGVYLGMFDCDFEVIAPAELKVSLHALGRRYLRALLAHQSAPAVSAPDGSRRRSGCLRRRVIVLDAPSRFGASTTQVQTLRNR